MACFHYFFWPRFWAASGWRKDLSLIAAFSWDYLSQALDVSLFLMNLQDKRVGKPWIQKAGWRALGFSRCSERQAAGKALHQAS